MIFSSVKRIVYVLLAFSLLLAFGYAGAWIKGFFPERAVVIGLSHGKRVIKVPEIREVVKWKTRTVNIPVEVMVPTRVTPLEPSKPGEKKDKKEQRFEDIFAGKVDLGTEYLLATGDLGPSDTGWKVATTIPKEGGKAHMTAVEKPDPLLFFGGDRRWYIGPGIRMTVKPGEPMQAETILGGGLEADALRIKKIRISAYLSADYGKQDGWEGRIIFGIGKKSHFGD